MFHFERNIYIGNLFKIFRKMFCYQDPQCRKFENDSPNSCIYVNSKELKVNRDVCERISIKLNKIFSQSEEPSKEDITFFIEDLSDNDLKIIENLFLGKKIEIQESYIKICKTISEYFEIESLSLLLKFLLLDKNVITKYFIQDHDLNVFYNLEKYILLLSNSNQVQESVSQCLHIIETIGENEFFKIFLKICQKSLLIPLENIIEFLCKLQKANQNVIANIITISKEIYEIENNDEHKTLDFILHQLYYKSVISKEDLQAIFNEKYPFAFIDVFGKEFYELKNYSLSEKEKNLIEDENFVLHRKGISEGYCQDPILAAIREDRIDFLQNLVQQSNLDIQNIKVKSEYERFEILQDNECSLFEYCALFGSTKCFNYFLSIESNYDLRSCIIYAIAGNSKEIISSLSTKINFNETYEIESLLKECIVYHRHQIFKWLFSTYFLQYNDIFLNISFENYNFHTLKYLFQYGFSLFDFFISTIYSNNSNLVKHSIELMKLFHHENYINIKKQHYIILYCYL